MSDEQLDSTEDASSEALRLYDKLVFIVWQATRGKKIEASLDQAEYLFSRFKTKLKALQEKKDE